MKKLVLLAAGAAGTLVFAASASAHARVSPPVIEAKTADTFTVWVPTEKEGARTVKIEMTPPKGFAIDSFEAAPGWKRTVEASGSGEEQTFTKVTWTATGSGIPTEEAAVFGIAASADSSKSYTIPVRQTYSNGDVVDWNGPESSDTPAPVVKAVSSLSGGGGGSTSTLAIVALAVGAVGVLIGIVALVGKGRPLA